jgi:tRNA dimethylallyltransferase
MTLYKAMDIGTAKPSEIELSIVPHHLIDVLNPEDEFSVADYISAAVAAVSGILDRGRVPLFVGGSGLYLRAILRGMFEGPAANTEIRRRLADDAERNGTMSLLDRLREVDPITATRLHVNDQRRIIRALEVFELTGQPMSAHQQQGPRPIEERPSHVYWLSPPRDWLHRRIDTRVEQMFADGLLAEVERLLARDRPISQTARQALGYKEVIDWIYGTTVGSSPQNLTELIALIQTRTRQFAKRQHTWFRNLEECQAISIGGGEIPEQITDSVLDWASTDSDDKSLAK